METMAREVARRLITREWGIRYIAVPKIIFREGVRTEHTRKDKRGHRVPVFQPYRVGEVSISFDKSLASVNFDEAYPHLVRGVAEYTARKISLIASEKVKTPSQKVFDHAERLFKLWTAPKEGDNGLVILSNDKSMSVTDFEKLKPTENIGRLASRVRLTGKRSTFYVKPEEPTPEEPRQRVFDEEEDDTCVLFVAGPVKKPVTDRRKKTLSWFGAWQHLVNSILGRCLPEEPMPKEQDNPKIAAEDDTCVLYQGKEKTPKFSWKGLSPATLILAREEKKATGMVSKATRKRISMETKLREAVRYRLADDIFLADIKQLPKVIMQVAPGALSKRYTKYVR